MSRIGAFSAVLAAALFTSASTAVESPPRAGIVSSRQSVLPAVGCPAEADNAAMASSLVCFALVPVPDLASVRGTVTLRASRSPFGAAVTVDGHPRSSLTATISGLPNPRSLGPFTTYVAWAYSLSLGDERKLGAATNGRVALGELQRAQFRILISAERSAAVSTRGGRLVLRGTSPGARLLAHRDLTQPSALPSGSSAHTAHDWTMPPMPPGMPMMPGMSGLAPETRPFLPAAATAVPVRARKTVRMKDGDTLVLEAVPVRRAVAGRFFTSYAFNGQLPGPLIEVTQSATITVRFHNGIDQPSAVHWHGVRLANAFDGAVGVTQDAVRPGQDFTYTVRFPDAGTYWYHPHVREDIQQSLGLYGNLLVRSSTPGYYAPVNREEVLTLDDLLLGADGPTPWGTETPTHALMGRWGNVLLVNGEPRPALQARRGDVVRYHLTNVSSARVYNISFGGTRMKVVAGDAGKLEREEWVQSVVIAPAERYVVEVEFARTGQVAMMNRVQALNHMSGAYSLEVDTLALVNVSDERARANYGLSFRTLRVNADVAASLAPFRKALNRPVDRELVLTLRTQSLPPAIANMLTGINAPVEWNDGMAMANWATTGNQVTWILRDARSGTENMDVDWRFRVGDVVKLRVFNDPAASHAMAHPIHLHGQRFLVLARDGARNANLGWKDTALIAAGETVDLLVDMSNPGTWMLHCHIAEHLSAGMMSVFKVMPR